MNSLFIDIRKKIIENEMFSDFYVDEDYGQLDPENDLEQVDFPCILSDIVQTEWDEPVRGTQTGACTVKVSLAIDCEDKELKNSIEEGIKSREIYFNNMHRLLHNFSTENCTPLIRKSFQTQSLPGSIKVYECIYTCTLKESIAPPDPATEKLLSVSIDPANNLPGRFEFPELENADE